MCPFHGGDQNSRQEKTGHQSIMKQWLSRFFVYLMIYFCFLRHTQEYCTLTKAASIILGKNYQLSQVVARPVKLKGKECTFYEQVGEPHLLKYTISDRRKDYNLAKLSSHLV